jgi:hypothetical protein
MILLLSALAGAVHVLAPDHWIPLSLKSWKEGWSLAKSLVISWLILSVHVTIGFVIYLGLESIFRLDSRHFFWAAGVVCVAAGFRSWRFPGLSDILKPEADPRKAWLKILLFVGPCESIVPIFIKARELGLGYLSVFGAFALGTLFAGSVLVLIGPMFWNHPLRLSNLLRAPGQRRIALPVIAAVSVGLVVLLRLT